MVNQEYICINSNFYGQLEKDSILLQMKSLHMRKVHSGFIAQRPMLFSLKFIDKNGINLDHMLSA